MYPTWLVRVTPRCKYKTFLDAEDKLSNDNQTKNQKCRRWLLAPATHSVLGYASPGQLTAMPHSNDSAPPLHALTIAQAAGSHTLDSNKDTIGSGGFLL